MGDKLPEQLAILSGRPGLPADGRQALNAPKPNVTFRPDATTGNSHTGGPARSPSAGPLSEEGRPARALQPGDTWRSRPTWSTGTARLPTAEVLRIWPSRNPMAQREYMARTGRRRAICSSDGFRPGPWPPCLGEDARRRLAELFPGGIPELGGCGPRII